MVRLIIGLKGSGKTKQLIEMTNKAVDSTKGNVVCVEKGEKLRHEIRREVRLIDTKLYGINGAAELYGLVSGILASNYDVKDLFIDSSLKICGDDMVAFVAFIRRLDELCAKLEVNCVTTVSIAPESFPEELSPYLF
ncbi:MAG: hypothetical protein IKT43_02990 [Clostridia bacterium]|nr:hypothetical protein [Clostridia bacterium]